MTEILAADLVKTNAAVTTAIEHAILENGLGDDPLGMVMRSFASVSRLITEVGVLIVETKLVAANAATSEMAETIVRGTGPMIAKAVDQASRQAVQFHGEAARRFDRRWYLKAGIVAVIVVVAMSVASAGLGFWLGRDLGRAEIAATTEDLRAAFREGAPGASRWQSLVRLNNIEQAMTTCEKIPIASGQSACKVALWIGPPPTPGPRQ